MCCPVWTLKAISAFIISCVWASICEKTGWVVAFSRLNRPKQKKWSREMNMYRQLINCVLLPFSFSHSSRRKEKKNTTGIQIQNVYIYSFECLSMCWIGPMCAHPISECIIGDAVKAKSIHPCLCAYIRCINVSKLSLSTVYHHWYINILWFGFGRSSANTHNHTFAHCHISECRRMHRTMLAQCIPQNIIQAHVPWQRVISRQSANCCVTLTHSHTPRRWCVGMEKGNGFIYSFNLFSSLNIDYAYFMRSICIQFNAIRKLVGRAKRSRMRRL